MSYLSETEMKRMGYMSRKEKSRADRDFMAMMKSVQKPIQKAL